ncbi:MAG: isoprenyl transferase [Bacteroidia bacterium]
MISAAQIDIHKLPRHVAIIMDGNGRWAKSKGGLRIFGHRSGIKAVREATEACTELGIEYLTLYTFSTENWNRPKFEVDALMSLLIDTIEGETSDLIKNGIKLNTIGEIEKLPEKCQRQLQVAMEKTSHNHKLILTLALSYGSRNDILHAVQALAEKVKTGELAADDISETVFKSALSTANLPDPELMIRTSGEMRISNFLLWELAYAELYVTPKLWPDFRKNDLFEAVLDFQKRERRFGKTSEQIS